MRYCELARGLAAPPGLLPRPWRGTGRLCWLRGGLGVDKQMVGAGEQLAGDRRGGDLLAAAAGDRLVAGGEVGVALGGLCCLAQDPPQPGGALLGDVPVADRAVAAADGRGEPGPGGQLACRSEPA